MYDLMLTQILDGSLFKHTKQYDAFKVKTSVFNVGPIQAKIGKKESLKIDDLFQVSENRQSKQGEKFVKNIGWVRAKKVMDNAKNADGKTEPSSFYEVYGGSIKKGMTMREVPETGIVIGTAFDIATSKNSVIGGPIVQIDFITHLAPGSRIGLGIGGFRTVESKSVDIDGVDQDYNIKGATFYGDLTYQKIIQLKMVEITPFAGAYFASMKIDKLVVDGKDYSLDDELPDGAMLTNSDIGGLVGFRAGINLGKHFQINMGYKLGFKFANITKYTIDGEEQEVKLNANYGSPSGLSFGIRLFGF
jgi:hypothetical protein